MGKTRRGAAGLKHDSAPDGRQRQRLRRQKRMIQYADSLPPEKRIEYIERVEGLHGNFGFEYNRMKKKKGG